MSMSSVICSGSDDLYDIDEWDCCKNHIDDIEELTICLLSAKEQLSIYLLNCKYVWRFKIPFVSCLFILLFLCPNILYV